MTGLPNFAQQRNGRPEAQQRTEEALAADTDIAPRLCNLWGRILNQKVAMAEGIEGMLGKLSCSSLP